MAIASIILGNAWVIDIILVQTISTAPPVYPEKTPITVPKTNTDAGGEQ